LLDSQRLATQLCSLERRTARSGKDSVDHPVGGHDDLANSACGALTHTVRSGGGMLGLVKYEQMVATGAIADPGRPMTVLERVRSRQENISDETKVCPHCGSDLLQKLAFGEIRCMQCAKQFAIATLPGLPESSFRGKTK
jgi:DNA-directed RNA polymerase subunit RPC12/RpoP